MKWYNWLGIVDAPVDPAWRPEDGPPARGWDIDGLLAMLFAVVATAAFWALWG